VVRGVAGAELLWALAGAAGIELVISIERSGRTSPLDVPLRALGVPVLAVTAADTARRPGKRARARMRTRLWDAYLHAAASHRLDLASTLVLGNPPPLEAHEQWRGRQAAVIGRDARTVAIGEVVRIADGQLELRCHVAPQPAHALLVRDARRESDGTLGTAGADPADAVRYVAPPDVLPGAASRTGPRPVVRAGPFTAALVNGVLGDPLLHVRLHHRRRSLLFDLGEAGRLPARVAHQVSDLFLSHAHIDHIAGFLWLVRSRMGDLAPLRVFGPPGIAAHVRATLGGVLWDRIDTRGPRFEVAELDGDRLHRVAIQAGASESTLAARQAREGILLEDDELEVRAVPLDHGHGTAVLAFALTTPRTLNVRKERLEASGLAPGPWLTRLKTLIAAGEHSTLLTLPDAREAAAGRLAEEFILEGPGIRLAYATDLADTGPNRDRLAKLGAGAHTLFCEASFLLEDEDQARRTGHLTTRACGEIAARAGAARLVPFHFSRRYENDLARCYDEVRAAFPRTITPPLRDSGE
jgi:ribonuclease BN (tRNA processing enzyme)